MSGPDPQLPPNDRELEDFLAGRGPQARRYREASQERSPAVLDASVLAQAAAAVAAPAQVRRRPPGRWRLPLSLAATLVLGVGLVSRVQQEAALPSAAESASEAAVAFDAAPSVAVTDARPEAPAEPAAKVEAPSVSEPATRAAGSQQRAAQEREAAAYSDARRARAEAAMAESMAASVMPAPAPPPPPVVPAPPAPEPPPAVPASPPLPTPSAAAAGSAPPSKPAAATAFAPLQESRREALKAAPAAPMAKRQWPAEPSADAASPPLLRFAPGHYRSEFDHRLELFADGRYRLSDTAPEGGLAVQAGQRRPEGEGERLRPDSGDDGCGLWLEPAGEAIRLRADCPSDYVGSYWREAE